VDTIGEQPDLDDRAALAAAFEKTGVEGFGGFFCGWFADTSEEAYDYFKRSSRNNWSRTCYALYLLDGGGLVPPNPEFARTEFEEANTPMAMYWLGELYSKKGEFEKAYSYHQTAYEMGWKNSSQPLFDLQEDLNRALEWSAKIENHFFFWDVMKEEAQNDATIMYLIGSGLYCTVIGMQKRTSLRPLESAVSTTTALVSSCSKNRFLHFCCVGSERRAG
jgi:hypothetical protein